MYLEVQNQNQSLQHNFPQFFFCLRLWLFSAMDKVCYETYDSNEAYDNMDRNPTENRVISVAVFQLETDR